MSTPYQSGHKKASLGNTPLSPYVMPAFDPGDDDSFASQNLRGSGMQTMSGPALYVTFTPSQASTLLAQLPDPDHHPMQFYRRLSQIQKNYSATWKDLESLCEIKAGDAYWPVMLTAFDPRRVRDTISYESGMEFCEQVKSWAQNRLADQAISIHDMVQDKSESVEKYQVRMLQVFIDLGFSRHNKTHTQMLSSAFVTGLQEHIRRGLIIARPEYRTLPLETLALVAKGLEASQQLTHKTTPLMLTESSPSGVKQSVICHYCKKPGHVIKDCKTRPKKCFNCDRTGHVSKDCKAPKRQHQTSNDGDHWPPPPPPDTPAACP